MYNVAIMLSKGVGVPKVDRKAALYWTRKTIACPEPAANDRNRLNRVSIGLAHAMLGNWYHNEIELPKDDALALYHWREGARLGAAGAHNMLGMCYENGWCDVKRNLANAVDHYRMACDGMLMANEPMVNMSSVWRQMPSRSAALRWLECALRFGVTNVSTRIELLRKEVDTHDDADSDAESLPIRWSSHLSADRLAKLYEFIEMDERTKRRADVRLSGFENEPPMFDELSNLVASHQTLYLKLLFDAKRILIHAFDSSMQGVAAVYVLRQIALALSIPDHGAVMNRLESAFVRTLLCLHLDKPEVVRQLTVDERALLTYQQRRTVVQNEEIELIRVLLREYPDSVFLQQHLACLLLFPGVSFDPEEAVRHFTRAISQVTNNSSMSYRRAILIDLHYLIGVALFKCDHCRGSEASRTVHKARSKAFFEEFLRLADGYGHRKEPLAHYHLAMLCMSDDLKSSFHGDVTKHYELGTNADSQLPAFLYSAKFPLRDSLKTMVTMFGSSSSTTTSKVAEKSAALSPLRSGGEALQIAGIDKRWFSGDNILLNHLRLNYDYAIDLTLIRAASQQQSTKNSSSSSSSSSSCSTSSTATITPILIDEIVSYCADKVFDGRSLKVVVVAPPLSVLGKLGVRLVIEDGRRYALPMTIQRHSLTEAVLSKLTVGTVLTVVNPYCSISSDYAKQILITSNNASSTKIDEQLSLCWQCLKCVADLKQCSRCGVARYCSTDCQKLNWTQFRHKEFCARDCI